MADNKKSFVLYADIIHTVRKMPRQKRADLFMAILEYVNDENPVISDQVVDLVFEPIKQQLKRDLRKWEVTQEKRKEAGKLGGLKSGISRRYEANEANASKTKQNEANEAVNVNGNVSVNVNGNVNDIEISDAKIEVFNIGQRLEKTTPAKFVKTNYTTLIETNLINYGKGRVSFDDFLAEFDKVYPAQTPFNSESHLTNCIRKTVQKLAEPAPAPRQPHRKHAEPRF